MSKKYALLLVLFAASTQVNAVGCWDWLFGQPNHSATTTKIVLDYILSEYESPSSDGTWKKYINKKIKKQKRYARAFKDIYYPSNS